VKLVDSVDVEEDVRGPEVQVLLILPYEHGKGLNVLVINRIKTHPRRDFCTERLLFVQTFDQGGEWQTYSIRL
jgi:hypothetical protein